MGKGTLELSRSNLRFNKYRRFSIIVDGNKVAAIRNNTSMALPVDPGRHSLYARIDLVKSNKIDFEIAPDQTCKFQIGDRKISSLQYTVFFLFVWFCVLIGLFVNIVGIIVLAPVVGVVYGLTLGKPSIQQVSYPDAENNKTIPSGEMGRL